MTSTNVDSIVREYESRQPAYETVCEEILELIERALEEAGIDVAGFSERVKSTESFREKLSRKDYDDPLEQIEDLAGVRVICLYDDDRERIADICAREFELIETADHGRALGSDRMGYSGTHLIVRLGSGFRGGRYKGITDLKCEIQIRTAVQDAWALISHGMVYKHEHDVPMELRRDLNHAAILLEIAQTKFDELRSKRAQYLAEINTEITSVPSAEGSRILNREINFDTLTAYVRWKFPHAKPNDKLTRMVIRDLNGDRFLTIADIDAAVERAKPAVDAYFAEAPELFGNGTDFLTKSLGFADLHFRVTHAFGQQTRQAFPQYSHLVITS